MVVTPLYAGLLVLWFLALSFQVIRCRRGGRISLGDGGDAKLIRVIRGHANFAEYVPVAILLLYDPNAQRAPPFGGARCVLLGLELR